MRHENKGFHEHVQLFYVEAFIQNKRRFPINDEVFKALAFLKPDKINSTPSCEVLQLASKFPNIIQTADIPKNDDEKRELQFMDPNDLLCLSSENSKKKMMQFHSGVTL